MTEISVESNAIFWQNLPKNPGLMSYPLDKLSVPHCKTVFAKDSQKIIEKLRHFFLIFKSPRVNHKSFSRFQILSKKKFKDINKFRFSIYNRFFSFFYKYILYLNLCKKLFLPITSKIEINLEFLEKS